ncbi:unnamed protein product [Sphenostylis stenocarpa]|uniref:Uncharacterized protein n=1 Tax=Sphenostylis stenocarpa TaxID=92480 RepID=A0AA86V5M8_9FABA|nr:unnamed protein product [Sphenostylis stenocarpa]
MSELQYFLKEDVENFFSAELSIPEVDFSIPKLDFFPASVREDVEKISIEDFSIPELDLYAASLLNYHPLVMISSKFTGCNENKHEEVDNLFHTLNDLVISNLKESSEKCRTEMSTELVHFIRKTRSMNLLDESMKETGKKFGLSWQDRVKLALSKDACDYDKYKKYGDVAPYGKENLFESFSAAYRSVPCAYICKRRPFITGMWNLSVEEVSLNVDWDGKTASKLQDMFNGCNLNKYEKLYEPFSPDKALKKTVQHVLSFVIATTVFLWIIMNTCSKLSILQPKHGPLFIWSSLVEPFCFMVFVWVIAATIVVGAQFSHMQSAMLMFWAILMVLKSAKSITEVCLPIFGILLTGLYVLMEKQPPHEG